jgi:hypothetical protein
MKILPSVRRETLADCKIVNSKTIREIADSILKFLSDVIILFNNWLRQMWHFLNFIEVQRKS